MILHIETKLLSVNKCWRGRRFKTKDYESYENEILYTLPKPTEMITGNVSVDFAFMLKNYKKADVDNLIKPLLDILTKKGYWKDDRQVVELRARKNPLYGKFDRERVNIEIKVI